jgi:16S rRNA (guanine527-N7)-methyltransferase
LIIWRTNVNVSVDVPPTGSSDFVPLIAGAAVLGLALNATQLARFASYRALLLEWNARFNLTAITEPAQVVTHHFLDSLTCVAALPASVRESGRSAASGTTVLDVGSGAGFPGLPLAIAFPGWHVTLLEATSKKVRFLEAAVAELGLLNVRAVAGRAEEYGRQPDKRGTNDVVVARAVAALPTLLEYCCPFTRERGCIVLPKKGDLEAETTAGRHAAGLLGAYLLDPIPVTVPPLDDGRVLLVARQKRPCPAQYPRAQGLPAKRPLS